MNPNLEEPSEFIRTTCPHLTRDEMLEADWRMRRLLMILKEIAENAPADIPSSNPATGQTTVESKLENGGSVQGSFGF